MIADRDSSVVGGASRELERAYAGVRVKAGKGVDHALTVAAILRVAGCEESVQVAGVLHDVVEDTRWTIGDVRDRYGDLVAGLVAAVTEDDEIKSYRRRKRALREQIARSGASAIDIALADKIASLRYALISGRRIRRRKLRHYAASVAMAPAAAHPALGEEAADLLHAVSPRGGG